MATLSDLLAAARSEIGRPYRWGGESEREGFDCSGLTQFVYGRVGVRLPRTSQEQQAAARPVSSPAPGDLVFYGRPAYHVGIYVGGGRMIDAPGTGRHVLERPVWGRPGYGRVLPGTSWVGRVAGGLGEATGQAAGGLIRWPAAVVGGIEQLGRASEQAGQLAERAMWWAHPGHVMRAVTGAWGVAAVTAGVILLARETKR